ncbi:hypothetical protein [Oxalicibacterium faecigallinarum]|uniref:Uncharacterized protein n=1 Tax=Oxalicibacterium faecigallinarum TaxID=573741 RepID=A0A8J3F7D0_9BURK|nr:hypothetical protein [Oxalicibacterium faecigallinarum]GGI20988.1 hypothetical protein GCM10008066_26760 [Oxalicibacterium faecigallinarum]
MTRESAMSMPIEYNGFKLMVTVERQTPDQAGSYWRGHFDFWRENSAQARAGTVSRAEPNPVDARNKTLRIAKSIIDAEMVREQAIRCTRPNIVEMASSL